MSHRSAPAGNAFRETMLGLRFEPRPDNEVDLFSRACVEQYRSATFGRLGYLFAQVFEPNVLVEAAMLAGVPYDSVADLSHRPTPAISRLAELAARPGDLTAAELIDLAAALISISRFGVAQALIEQVHTRDTRPLETFEAWMLAFVVANRRGDQPGVTGAFGRMRATIDAAALPPDRVLDACAQAVVWHMKRHDLAEADFRWWLGAGRSIAARRTGVDPGSLSSWYRALAMVPAARGDARMTRTYMDHARETAEAAVALRPRAYEKHFEKTYHESTLKEHMYVTRDFDRAQEAGLALIAMDPAWAPSYAELADAYLFFGHPRQAATMYDAAVRKGPPYYGYHLMRAARAYAQAGLETQALDRYLELSALVPGNEDVLAAGLRLADGRSPRARAHFEHLRDELTSGRAEG